MSQRLNIGVLGGGSWATALVKILCDNGRDKTINWWLRSEDKVRYIKEYGHNPDYISSVELHLEKLNPSAQIEEVIINSDWIILAIPSAFVHSALKDIDPNLFQGKQILSAVKGLIPETHQILGDYLPEQLGISKQDVGVITGPCHAEEVALEKLSYLTMASTNSALVGEMCELFECRYIRTVPSDDIYGTEYSAVLKNVYAIAAGVCHGMGYGDNFLAVLISNAIREIKRFIEVVHPIERDIDDSAYLGDLMVTAYSQFSRNRTFGNMLGKGYSVRSAQLEMNMIAEGYYATSSIFDMEESKMVEMPILNFVYGVIYEHKRPRKIVGDLLSALN